MGLVRRKVKVTHLDPLQVRVYEFANGGYKHVCDGKISVTSQFGNGCIQVRANESMKSLPLVKVSHRQVLSVQAQRMSVITQNCITFNERDHTKLHHIQ